ncbi:unnamed protein product [Cyprideis torosa]|uniref:Uncharacterized protein n=1 Tax=Cyprideis torosa TaxID=163714 RepID=A0A7R8ZPH6_9CRUS|nr:unnamed protein product [Cyprideis torosa]CAG0888401.1 unnamed protein product [Cyprideis torosa]
MSAALRLVGQLTKIYVDSRPSSQESDATVVESVPGGCRWAAGFGGAPAHEEQLGGVVQDLVSNRLLADVQAKESPSDAVVSNFPRPPISFWPKRTIFERQEALSCPGSSPESTSSSFARCRPQKQAAQKLMAHTRLVSGGAKGPKWTIFERQEALSCPGSSPESTSSSFARCRPQKQAAQKLMAHTCLVQGGAKGNQSKSSSSETMYSTLQDPCSESSASPRPSTK